MNALVLLIVNRVVIKSIITEFVLSFYKFNAIIDIKLYAISFDVLFKIIKIKLFK